MVISVEFTYNTFNFYGVKAGIVNNLLMVIPRNSLKAPDQGNAC
jgi:hypothetical protein